MQKYQIFLVITLLSSSLSFAALLYDDKALDQYQQKCEKLAELEIAMNILAPHSNETLHVAYNRLMGSTKSQETKKVLDSILQSIQNIEINSVVQGDNDWKNIEFEIPAQILSLVKKEQEWILSYEDTVLRQFKALAETDKKKIKSEDTRLQKEKAIDALSYYIQLNLGKELPLDNFRNSLLDMKGYAQLDLIKFPYSFFPDKSIQDWASFIENKRGDTILNVNLIEQRKLLEADLGKYIINPIYPEFKYSLLSQQIENAERQIKQNLENLTKLYNKPVFLKLSECREDINTQGVGTRTAQGFARAHYSPASAAAAASAQSNAFTRQTASAAAAASAQPYVSTTRQTVSTAAAVVLTDEEKIKAIFKKYGLPNDATLEAAQQVHQKIMFSKPDRSASRQDIEALKNKKEQSGKDIDFLISMDAQGKLPLKK